MTSRNSKFTVDTTGARIAWAAERAAAELALQRLAHERRQIDRELSAEASLPDALHHISQRSAEMLADMQLLTTQQQANEKARKAAELRNFIAAMTLVIPGVLWLADNLWSWNSSSKAWLGFSLCLLVLAFVQVQLKRLQREARVLVIQSPVYPTLPARQLTGTERELIARRAQIDVEADEHLAVVRQGPGQSHG